MPAVHGSRAPLPDARPRPRGNRSAPAAGDHRPRGAPRRRPSGRSRWQRHRPTTGYGTRRPHAVSRQWTYPAPTVNAAHRPGARPCPRRIRPVSAAGRRRPGGAVSWCRPPTTDGSAGVRAGRHPPWWGAPPGGAGAGPRSRGGPRARRPRTGSSYGAPGRWRRACPAGPAASRARRPRAAGPGAAAKWRPREGSSGGAVPRPHVRGTARAAVASPDAVAAWRLPRAALRTSAGAPRETLPPRGPLPVAVPGGVGWPGVAEWRRGALPCSCTPRFLVPGQPTRPGVRRAVHVYGRNHLGDSPVTSTHTRTDGPSSRARPARTRSFLPACASLYGLTWA